MFWAAEQLNQQYLKWTECNPIFCYYDFLHFHLLAFLEYLKRLVGFVLLKRIHDAEASWAFGAGKELLVLFDQSF